MRKFYSELVATREGEAPAEHVLLMARQEPRPPIILALPSRAHYTARMADVTQLLEAIQQGQPQAAEQLLPLVYDELRKLARSKLRQEKPGQTLQATALVHEAYLRLVGGKEVRDQKSEVSGNPGEPTPSNPTSDLRLPTSDLRSPTSDLRSPTSDLWHSRGHFFAAAA